MSMLYYDPTPEELSSMILSSRKQYEYLCAIRQRKGLEMLEDGKSIKDVSKIFNVSTTTICKWDRVFMTKFKKDWIRGMNPITKKHNFKILKEYTGE